MRPTTEINILGKVCYRRNALDWMAVFAELPPRLTFIKFLLSLEKPIDLDYWGLSEVPPSIAMIEASFLHQASGMLDIPCKQACRRSPGVDIKWANALYWGGWSRDDHQGASQEQREMLDAACKSTEGWSKEWLDRWEETQVDYEMVSNWRKQRQDWGSMFLARKSQEPEQEPPIIQ